MKTVNAGDAFKTKSGMTGLYVNTYAGREFIQVYDIPFTEDCPKPLYDSNKKKGGYYRIDECGAMWKEHYTEDGYPDPICVKEPYTPVSSLIEYVAENN